MTKIWAFVGGGAIAILAAGSFIFMFPPTPPLRPQIESEMEAIDSRTGVYEDGAGARFLITPALHSGFHQFPVDAYGPATPIAAQELEGRILGTGLNKVAVQPYALRERETENSARLEAWLFEPPAPKAAIVILHGSGDSDRENSWYIYLTDFLARNGYIVLLPDKRGSGRSEGDWRQEALTTLAEDGARWIDALRTDYPQIGKFGVIGVSQGGMIAPTAARIAKADFAVGLSVTASSLNEQLPLEVGNDVKAAGIPKSLQPLVTAVYTQRAKNRYGAFWRKNGDFNTLTEWEAWGGPFLIALGRDDEEQFVPVSDSLEKLKRVDGRNGRLQWRVYDGVRHSLCYRDGPEKNVFHHEFQREIIDWLDAASEKLH